MSLGIYLSRPQVSGFQLAVTSGPLCDEPMSEVAFVVETLVIGASTGAVAISDGMTPPGGTTTALDQEGLPPERDAGLDAMPATLEGANVSAAAKRAMLPGQLISACAQRSEHGTTRT